MSQTRRRGTTAIIAGMAVLTVAIGAFAYQASADSSSNTATGGSSAGLMAAQTRPRPTPAPTVPAELAPPAGLRRIGTFAVVKGTQTYTCASGSFAGASVPEASLAGPFGRIHHFAGPSWQSVTDKSLVTATPTVKVAVAGSIPQLLLTVTSHTGTTRGLLSRVQAIQRLNTSGGAAPTTACTDGETVAVPYKANYVLWAN
jgi:uncharacterized protein DUF3455